MTEPMEVPGWPVVTIEMSDADSVVVDGERIPVPQGADPRMVAVERVTKTAQLLHRPVRCEAIEADGTIYPLVVAPDSTVSEAGPRISPKSRKSFGRRRGSPAAPPAPPAAPGQRRAPTGAMPLPQARPEPQAEEESAAPAPPFHPAHPAPEAEAPQAPTPQAPAPAPQAPMPMPMPMPQDPMPQAPAPQAPAPPPVRAEPPVSPQPPAPPEPAAAPEPPAPPVSAVSPEPPAPAEQSAPVPPPMPPAAPTAAPAAEPAPPAPQPAAPQLAAAPAVRRPSPPPPPGTPRALPVPTPEQSQALRGIRAAVASGNVGNALHRALALEDSVRQTGEEPERLIAAREISAYVTMLAGDTDRAVGMFARAAVDRVGIDGTSDPWATRLAKNAHYCWLQVTNTERAFEVGPLVLRAYAAVAPDAGPEASAARHHLDVLRERVAAS